MRREGVAKVAFVTGASRGIGRACAVALAGAGFDVAISARTVDAGEEREHSPTIRRSDTSPLPGSLRQTEAEIAERGRRALVVPADLLDFVSLRDAATATLRELGRIDVVVHNGRYVGAGHMDRLGDTPIELIERQLRANVLGALVLDEVFIPAMLQRRSGTIITITSAVAYADPLAPAGEGGWGLGYGASKAAQHRVAGFLNVEYGSEGIRAFNVQPGMIDTERTLMESGPFGFGGWGAPADVVGGVVAWLATGGHGDRFLGETVEAQFLCHELGLLPGWEGPRPNQALLRYDRSGARLQQLETALQDRSVKEEGPR
jgi:NAD(P)-dependent dehydrogenase (short-subunit alcohol dehydrogenase family)